MLIVVLPLTYSLLGSRLSMRPVLRDLVVARVSVIFLILGTLAIGLAPSPWLLIAGKLPLFLYPVTNKISPGLIFSL